MGIFKRKKKQQQVSCEQKTTEIVLAELDNVIQTGMFPASHEPDVSIITNDIKGVFTIEFKTIVDGVPISYDGAFKRPNLEKKISEWLIERGLERFEEQIFGAIISSK